MIVRPRPTLFTLLFALRGSILPRVAPTVIGLTAFAVLVVAAEQRWPEAFPVTAGVGPFTLIGIALSIFLSFRNGACYERWWEGRKAWGALVVETRGLARLLTALFPGPEHDPLRRTALRSLCGFAHGLHASLRGTDEAAAIAPWLPSDGSARLSGRQSPTDALLALLLGQLAEAFRRGALSDVLFGVAERKVPERVQAEERIGDERDGRGRRPSERA